MHRILDWQKSVLEAGGMFSVSIDVTGGTSVVDTYANAGIYMLHTWNESEMRDAYPAVAVVRQRVGNIGSKSLGWGMQVEPANLWLRFMRSQSAREIEYVWLIEEDVGFSGDLASGLLAEYLSEPADLITHNAHFRENWGFLYAATAEFLEKIPVQARIVSSENTRRYSARFLDDLHKLGEGSHPLHLGKPMLGWSEMASPSLCQYLGLKTVGFRSEHIGDPFLWNGRLSAAQWRQIMSESDHRNKLYHALKF